jgi:hypothetical protein
MAAAKHVALVFSSLFQKDGLPIIDFDEEHISDSTSGGGHVAIVVSPQTKQGFQSTTLYQH